MTLNSTHSTSNERYFLHQVFMQGRVPFQELKKKKKFKENETSGCEVWPTNRFALLKLATLSK